MYTTFFNITRLPATTIFIFYFQAFVTCSQNHPTFDLECILYYYKHKLLSIMVVAKVEFTNKKIFYSLHSIILHNTIWIAIKKNQYQLELVIPIIKIISNQMTFRVISTIATITSKQRPLNGSKSWSCSKMLEWPP